MNTEKQLDILHDHYKETFARMRASEKSRDRLFVFVIGLFALLSLEIGYPAGVGGALGKVTVAGLEFDLRAVPLPALLDASWVLTLYTVLRYCQTAVLVNRQYPYLHMLERNVSRLLIGGMPRQVSDPPDSLALDADVYKRESDVYLHGYPVLLNVAWFAYAVLFPAIAITAASWLAYLEWTTLRYPSSDRALAFVAAGSVIAVFFFYVIWPGLGAEYGRLRAWMSKRHAPNVLAETAKQPRTSLVNYQEVTTHDEQRR